MKFTNGYWMLKPEYDISFAIEHYRSQIINDTLQVLCPSVPIRSRGTFSIVLRYPYPYLHRLKMCCGCAYLTLRVNWTTARILN